MTKDFCDRCGNLISDNHSLRGDNVELCGPKGEKSFWLVSVKVTHAFPNWKLCYVCFDAVVDEAYRFLVAKRAQRDNPPVRKLSSIAERLKKLPRFPPIPAIPEGLD